MTAPAAPVRPDGFLLHVVEDHAADAIAGASSRARRIAPQPRPALPISSTGRLPKNMLVRWSTTMRAGRSFSSL